MSVSLPSDIDTHVESAVNRRLNRTLSPNDTLSPNGGLDDATVIASGAVPIESVTSIRD
jgi:hypothetical protein